MHDTDKNPEKFSFGYLPEPVAVAFREALGCYRHGLLQAFASMCRQTMHATLDDLGDSARLQIFDQVEEVLALADVDDAAVRYIQRILFDTDSLSLYGSGSPDRESAAVLLETMKDVLHEAYIRRALLRQKLKMRRFFAAQTDQDELLDERNDPKISRLRKP